MWAVKMLLQLLRCLEKMRKISLSRPYIDDQALDGVVSVIKSGWLSQGKKVEEFENAIKNKLNIKYALAVNSATSGLHAGLLALGVGNGDEVIVTSLY
jgi:perosamine synthetase